MRRFIPVFILIILVLAIYPFVGLDDNEKSKLTGLPWQIELLADGSTEVFGLVPGSSTLAQAVEALGDDYELAIVANDDEPGLEMYFGSYRAGLMSAKIVLAAAVDQQILNEWQQRSEKTEYMQSGTARKAALAEEDIAAALQSKMRVITFIPAVNLDDEIIRKRFGEPSETISSEPGITHYLYPEKGLDIVLSTEGKEILQYVAPSDFTLLQAPLTQDSAD